MKNLIIDRDDFNSSLHPNMFDDICRQFGLDPLVTDRLELKVIDAVKVP